MGYFARKGISNSCLSYINPDQEGSPQKFKRWLDGTLSDESSPSLEKGDLIHKFKLEPELYQMAPINKASDAICAIIDEVYANRQTLCIDDYRADIERVSFERGYQANWKAATRIDKVIEQGQEYWDFLCSNSGKVVLDHSTFVSVQECMMSLNRNPAASKMLDVETGNGISVYNELEIYWTVEIDGEVIECKSKIDKLVLNTRKKQFSIRDLKTTSKHIARYPESFSFWHTYRQLAFYEDAVTQWIKVQLEADYTPASHYIVAVMTKEPYMSRVFKVDRPWIEKGRKEYQDLLRRIQYHTQTGNWIYEQEEEQNRGVYSLEIPALFSLSALTATASN